MAIVLQLMLDLGVENKPRLQSINTGKGKNMNSNRQTAIVYGILILLVIVLVFLILGINPSPPISIRAAGTPSTEQAASPPLPVRKLNLGKTAFPTTYSRVGDNIRYNYFITNLGNTIWEGSRDITDDSKAQVTCQTVDSVGNRNNAFDPSETIPCYATYIITQADIEAGSVTHTAHLEGAEPAVTTITSGCHPPEGWVAYDVRSTDTLDEISTWYSD